MSHEKQNIDRSMCLNLCFKYMKTTHIQYANPLFSFQNYDSSESKLRREFEVYGPIRKVRLVTDVDR